MSNVGKRGKLSLRVRLRDALLKGTNSTIRHHEIREVIDALSKSPAREDAQPVAKPAPFNPGGIGHAMYQAFNAYLADYVLSTDGDDYVPTPFERDLIEDFFAGLMAEESFFGPVRALYDTHPATDALRVAVEALEPFARVMIDVGESESDDDTFRNARREYARGPTITVGHVRRAASALAALQAEQGAK